MPSPTRRTRTAIDAEHRRWFTPEQANASLVYVARIVADITRRYNEAVALRLAVDEAPTASERGRAKTSYETAMDDLNRFLGELHDVGVELRDFERGLVDFPSRTGRRETILCWSPGEERVKPWHDLPQRELMPAEARA